MLKCTVQTDFQISRGLRLGGEPLLHFCARSQRSYGPTKDCTSAGTVPLTCDTSLLQLSDCCHLMTAAHSQEYDPPSHSHLYPATTTTTTDGFISSSNVNHAMPSRKICILFFANLAPCRACRYVRGADGIQVQVRLLGKCLQIL